MSGSQSDTFWITSLFESVDHLQSFPYSLSSKLVNGFGGVSQEWMGGSENFHGYILALMVDSAVFCWLILGLRRRGGRGSKREVGLLVFGCDLDCLLVDRA